MRAAFQGLEFENPDRPEATNLITIYSLVTGMSTVRAHSSTAVCAFHALFSCLRSNRGPNLLFGSVFNEVVRCVGLWYVGGWEMWGR
jgi:hypothetical protein